MSLETFQNVDDWLVSTDVGSVPTPCWMEEELGCVPGLDDDATGASYLTSCTDDSFGHYNVTDCLNDPIQNAVSECWLDINEVLPYDKALDNFCVLRWSDGAVIANEFGIQSHSVESGREQQPEVSISELESVLLMDSNGHTGGIGELTGCMMAEPNEHNMVHDNTITQFDYVHHIVEEEQPTVSYDIDDDLSSEEDEDDSRDVTWSYHTPASRAQRRRGRRRSKPSRRLSAARNNTADERKKQQNKSAATRYREKKRAEEVENEIMCAELERRNKELHTRVQDMTQEVAVLRQLVIDIFRSPNVSTA